MFVSGCRRWMALAVWGGILSTGPAVADSSKTQFLLQRAQQHEKAGEWDKAYAFYDEILKTRRDAPGIKDRQLGVLRRFWQEQRHNDPSYRKEVLGLDYGQATHLYGIVFDTLLESSSRNDRITPGLVLRRGIEELHTALSDTGFVQSHANLASGDAIRSFRAFLERRRTQAAGASRAACLKAMREIALAGQSALQLAPTVSIMELACGSCYAIDEYTAYLTPNQFRELADTFKAPPAFMTSVRFEMKTLDLGYLHVSLFQDSTPQEVDAAFLALSKAGMKGLILDLRGNSGGLLESAVEVARRFLANGVIGSSENYESRLSTVYQARNPAAWSMPLLVLVDGDTASAAEVLAGALKENGRARTVGQPTFGKGFTQGLVKLPEAVGGVPTGGLRLTIARFFSPKGLPYHGQGVTPDFLVPRMSEMTPLEDPALNLAIAELQRQILQPSR